MKGRRAADQDAVTEINPEQFYTEQKTPCCIDDKDIGRIPETDPSITTATIDYVNGFEPGSLAQAEAETRTGLRTETIALADSLISQGRELDAVIELRNAKTNPLITDAELAAIDAKIIEASDSFARKMGIDPSLQPEMKAVIAEGAALTKEGAGYDITDMEGADVLTAPFILANQMNIPLAERFGIKQRLEEGEVTGRDLEGDPIIVSECSFSLSTCTIKTGATTSIEEERIGGLFNMVSYLNVPGAKGALLNSNLGTTAESVKTISRNSLRQELANMHPQQVSVQVRNRKTNQLEMRTYEVTWFKYQAIKGDPTSEKIGFAYRERNQGNDNLWLGFAYDQKSGSWEIMLDESKKDDAFKRKIKQKQASGEPIIEIELQKAIIAKIPSWKVMEYSYEQ